MRLEQGDITLRDAVQTDCQTLCAWWNDGRVMAHAGFPNGLGTTVEQIAQTLSQDSDETRRRLILERSGAPIGEMSYRNLNDGSAEIGIKICDFSQQNKGSGRVALSLLIRRLFFDLGYRAVVLDTNLNNLRAQHVYETLGFRRVRVRKNAWRDQLGALQSSVDYELTPAAFVDFTKR